MGGVVRIYPLSGTYFRLTPPRIYYNFAVEYIFAFPRDWVGFIYSEKK